MNEDVGGMIRKDRTTRRRDFMFTRQECLLLLWDFKIRDSCLRIVARYGIPSSIICDRDGRFTSNFWKSFQKDLGIDSVSQSWESFLQAGTSQEFSRVHHTFHVSNLKKCYCEVLNIGSISNKVFSLERESRERKREEED
ncbi:putative reverse transcriptase domain-containing protein [Tanacetum coccineum]